MRLYSLAMITVLWTMWAAAPAFSQSKLSEIEFRDHVIAVAKAQDSSLDIEIAGPLSFKIHDAIANLDSGYREYLGNPAQLNNVVDRWVQMFRIAAAGDGFAASDLSGRLVMLVRNRIYLDGAPPDLPPENQLVWHPLAGDVIALLMVDYPTTRASVTYGQLAEANISTDDAWRIAKENSTAAMGALQIGSIGQNGPVAISAESGLATALLADPDACSANGPLTDAFVMVVDRDTFIVGRTSDAWSLRAFWAFARTMTLSANAFSNTPLTCEAGELVEATAPN
ncbi:MAG: hypothetical protein R3C46_17070 [Hyphomonadaceae bacterium]